MPIFIKINQFIKSFELSSLNQKVYYSYFKAIVFVLLVSLTLGACKSKKDTISTKSKEPVFKKWYFEQKLIEASKEKILGNYKESMAIYQECLKMLPNSSVVMYEMSKLYRHFDDISASVQFAEKAVEHNKSNKWYALQLADLYLYTDKTAEAIAIYENLVEDYPEEDEFQYELANLYIDAGQKEKALALLDKIENINGVSEALSLTKVKLYFQTRQKEKIFNEIEKLIYAHPEEFKFKLLLAEYYQQFNEKEQVDKLYNQIINDYPDNGMVQISVGNYYKVKGLIEKSHDSFVKAFNNPELNLDTKISILVLNYSFFDEKLKNKAFELLEILESTYPNNNKVTSLLAEYYMKNMEFAKAADALRKIMDSEKKSYDYWERLIAIDIELNKYSDLYKDSKNALEYFPNQAVMYFYNGLAAYNLGKYNEAIDVLSVGLDFTVNNKELESQFHTFLGESYFRLEMFEDSYSSFDQTLKINPNDKIVLNNYSYYLALNRHNLEKALVLIEKCIALEPENSTFLDTYAWVLFCNEKFQDALVNVEKSLKLGGQSNAVIVEHYGDILYKLDRKADAVEQWKLALEMKGGSELLEQKALKGKYIE